MNMIRTFIAISLPSQVKQIINQYSTILQRQIGGAVRWVSTENIHLTLKFIGDISPASLKTLTEALQTEASQHAQFTLKISGLGVYPNRQHPRVLWIGVQAPNELGKLQNAIATTTARLGYPTESKSFSPHLTIGRVRDHIRPSELQTIKHALDTTQVSEIGEALVNCIQLFRSDLRPEGPIYTSLFRVPLALEKHEQTFTR